jgi:hypothetical protein
MTMMKLLGAESRIAAATATTIAGGAAAVAL